jgi:hypothetical protein
MSRFGDPDRTEACVSELLLDRHLVGETSEEEREALGRHLERCERCAGRLEAMRDDRQSYRQTHTAADVAALRERATTTRRSGTAAAPWLGAAVGLAAAAAALVVAVAPPSGVRTKGTDRLSFWVKHGDAVRAGGPEEVVFPGDRLQFVVALAEPRFVAVLSVDGAGSVNRYYPIEPRMARLDAGMSIRLPLSTTLDEVLGREIVYGVFCEEQRDVEALMRAVRAGPRHPVVPRGCTVDVTEIVKAPAREP